jgi:ABC-type multidrug transport system ATPase subunit
MTVVARDAPAAAPLQLSVSDLVVRFGPLTALDGVGFDVRAGELVALAGENGAGKTTLVRCIAGEVAPASRCATTSTSPPTCCSAASAGAT